MGSASCSDSGFLLESNIASILRPRCACATAIWEGWGRTPTTSEVNWSEQVESKSASAEHLEQTAGQIVPAQPFSQPLIFISHDSRDKKLAEAFEALLQDVSAGVLMFFRSTDNKRGGIPFGKPWFDEIMQKLSASTRVVALLTERSYNRPWILFEAGVANGKTIPVIALSVGMPVKDAVENSPLAHVQNVPDDEEALIKLVRELVGLHRHANPTEQSVKRAVRRFKKVQKDFLLAAKNEPAD